MKLAKINKITIITSIVVLINLSLAAHFLLTRTSLFETNTAPAYILDRTNVPAGEFEALEGNEALSRYEVYLEWRLVSEEKDGNFIVETYQEFEIYKDGKETARVVATPNYQYLRYWADQ